MEFQPGNQLWRVRSTHGRQAIVSDPAILWDAFVEYCEWSYDNVDKIKHWVGKNAEEVYHEYPKALTIKAFSLFIGASESWWRQFKTSKTVTEYKPEREGDLDFSTVVARIEDTCYVQKFQGAAIGMYKENLISKELGLRDKVDADITSGGEKIEKTQTVIKWGNKEIRV